MTNIKTSSGSLDKSQPNVRTLQGNEASVIAQLPVVSTAIFLCNECLKLQSPIKGGFFVSHEIKKSAKTQHYLEKTGENSCNVTELLKNVRISRFRKSYWHCSRCGVTIKVVNNVVFRDGKTAAFSQLLAKSNKQRLRRGISKLQKTLRSSLGTSSDVTDGLTENRLTENNPNVNDKRVTPSHSRSTSGTSRSQASCNWSDYDFAECSDSNGQYFMVKQRSSGGKESDCQASLPQNSASSPVDVPGNFSHHNTSPSTPVSVAEFSSQRTPLSTSSTPVDSRTTKRSDNNSAAKLPSSSQAQMNGHESGQPHWSKSSSASALPVTANISRSHEQTSSMNAYSTSPNLSAYREAPETAGTLFLPVPESAFNADKTNKQSSLKKKKRSPSWYNVLSPSYKQKNDDLHKFFKTLPETERLLVDYACALVKDILVQGRMYVSQNYVCFHSNILKWQTAVLIPFKDIETITKEKTVKVIPNAIQIKAPGKAYTFTSFTQRARAFQQIKKLLENALKDEPITPQELWSSIHNHYGDDLGCSSDDDYVKPETPDTEMIEFDAKKSKRKKKHAKTAKVHHESAEFNRAKHRRTSNKNEKAKAIPEQSSDEDKSSARDSVVDASDESLDEDYSSEVKLTANDDCPAEHAMEGLRRVYLVREYQISAAEMFDTIFGETCSFWTRYLAGKGCYEVNFGKWTDGAGEHEGHRTRFICYNLPITNPLGPKSSKIEETQVFYKESQPERCYSTECIARTLGVPYADYFSSLIRYCIRKLSKNSCELRITAEIKYHKTPWGLVKNFIDKNVHSGMQENFLFLERELDKYLSEEARLMKSTDLERNGGATSARKRSGDGPGRRLPNGNVVRTQNEFPAAPSTEPVAAPSSDEIRQYNVYHKVESKSAKWLPRVAVILFAFLIWSNYSMYQRMSSLEALHSRISSNDFDFSVLKYEGVVDATQSRDVKLEKGIYKLERRLAKLESTFQRQVDVTDERWSHVTKEWKDLRNSVNEVLRSLRSKMES